MSNEKLQFNQSIKEVCRIQDSNIKKALDDKKEAETKFQEQLDKLKTLTKDRDQKYENLSKLKLALNKNFQKLNKMHSLMSAMNERSKNAEDDISRSNLDLQIMSDGFMQKIKDMDGELKTLNSQFEEETLMNLLSDLNIELLKNQETAAQFQSYYEKFKQSSIVGRNEYERLTILENIIDDAPDRKEIEEIEKKSVNKLKNIQYLTTEYEKKIKLLQQFE